MRSFTTQADESCPTLWQSLPFRIEAEIVEQVGQVAAQVAGRTGLSPI
jgi:hypothetical protein